MSLGLITARAVVASDLRITAYIVSHFVFPPVAPQCERRNRPWSQCDRQRARLACRGREGDGVLACEPGTVHWLVISVGLSLVLTVLLNVALRVFPETARRLARGVTTLTSSA